MRVEELKTPTIVLSVAALSFVVIVGGSLAASVQFARAMSQSELPLDEGAPESSSERPERRKPSKRREPSAELPIDTSCAAGCPFPGSICEASTCRLAPGARWALRPDRVLVRGAPGQTSVVACVAPPGMKEQCFVARSPQAAGDFTVYVPDAAPKLEVSSEQLDKGAVRVRVGDERGWGPVARFIASETLFAKGPLLRVAPEGSGIQFEMRPLQGAAAE